MSDYFEHIAGATPIDLESQKGLKLGTITTRDQLNAAEQNNILKALNWADTSRALKTIEGLLTIQSQRLIHKQMFNDVWRWAGEFRRVDANIGCAWPEVPVQLMMLLEDVLFQVATKADFAQGIDELTIRFHHRLVSVHPFPNGNGRHACLASDLLIQRLGGTRFSWGSMLLEEPSRVRERYLEALRIADSEFDYTRLIQFARSNS